jgi:excinuclease UvrABC ATPase subunit
MQFLSDVYLRCPDCDGTRYRAEVLEVKLAGKCLDRRRARHDGQRSARFFAAHPEVKRALQPLADVGLEYLRSASRCRRCPAARRSASSSPAIWPNPHAAEGR